MEITAEAKYIKISPRKVRLVAGAVRKLSPAIALARLALMPKRAAGPVAAVLKSALANATNKQSLRPDGLNAKLSSENLVISSITIGGGPVLKRWRPVSRGRAHTYKKRMSHIKIILSDDKSQISHSTSSVQANLKSQIEKKTEEEK